MKIRLFKPKTPSNTEISIAVEAFNSQAHHCLKGNILFFCFWIPGSLFPLSLFVPESFFFIEFRSYFSRFLVYDYTHIKHI